MKPAKLDPAVRIDGGQALAAGEHVDDRAALQRRGGIVEGRGAGTDHGDALAAKRLEIDGVGRMGVAFLRQ